MQGGSAHVAGELPVLDRGCRGLRRCLARIRGKCLLNCADRCSRPTFPYQFVETLPVSSVSRGIDRIAVTFDEPGLVANAGLLLVATLMKRLDLEALVDTMVRIPSKLGGFSPGRKVLTLVHALVARASQGYRHGRQPGLRGGSRFRRPPRCRRALPAQPATAKPTARGVTMLMAKRTISAQDTLARSSRTIPLNHGGSLKLGVSSGIRPIRVPTRPARRVARRSTTQRLPRKAAT